MRVSKRSGRVAAALTFVVLAGSIGEAQRQGGIQRGLPEEILPEAVEVVSPCCPSGPEYDRFPPVLARDEAPPEGKFFDEETYRRLKEMATFNPLAPDGRDVGIDDEYPEAIVEEFSTHAPKTEEEFNGLDMETSGGFFPPDTNLAVGPDRIVQATNVAFRLSTKSNNEVVIQTLNDHFGKPAGAFLFDPKVYYDPLSKRFFLVALQFSSSPNRSFVFLSVSRSNSPSSLASADDWCKYRIKAKVKQTWADYPGLGMNEEWVAVGTNNFGFSGGFNSSRIWAIAKPKLVDNSSKCPKISVFRFTAASDASGSLAFNVQPAQHYSESELPGTPLFLASTRPSFASNVLVLWRLGTTGSGSAASKPALSRANITARTSFSMPPGATQRGKGTTLDTGDTRVMQQLPFIDGALWMAFATGCNIGGGSSESCIRVTRISLTAEGGTVDFEDTFGSKDHYVWWPGLAVSSDGDVVAAFQQAGKKRNLSIAFNGMKASGSQFDAIKSLQKGKCVSNQIDSGARNRTGDYIGVQPDPSGDGSFWITGEFSKKKGGSCDWFTKIAKVSY